MEEAFKTLKSDLNLRPIHHQVQQRVEAHILVAFLGYCLAVTLRLKLRSAAPGLTPQAVLQSLAAIQMVDVEVPTADGRTLLLRRHTEPEAAAANDFGEVEIDAASPATAAHPRRRNRTIG